MAVARLPSEPPPRTLAEVLRRNAVTRPATVAVRFEARELDYAALHAQSQSAAATLWHGWGVRPGDRVAWLGFNHVDQLVLLFALAQIGAILLPLNVRLAPVEWDGLVADCTPGYLVHDTHCADAAQALAQRNGLALYRADAITPGNHWPAAPLHDDPAAPALLVYTSGTTSKPRAAVHTQANLLANMQIASAVQEIGAGDVVLTVLPLFHAGGLCIQTLPALFAGARVLLHPRFDAGATLAAIAQQRVTLTLLVPATMKALVEHPAWPTADLSSLRAVWAGSSLLPAKLVEAFHLRGVPVCNVYGATETGPFSIALPPHAAFDHVGSCGWPAPGVEVRRGDAGELLLRAPNIARAYWPVRPTCDDDGWFHTGDLATQAADGSYTVVGRAKDLIISGGENIHPAEIENLLGAHPAVAECAAFAMPDAQWGEVVAVAVVLTGTGVVGRGDLEAFLAPQLARFKMPRHWLVLEVLPKTALGKIQRSALADRFR